MDEALPLVDKGGMPIQILRREQVELLRKKYPEGTHICLDHMEGERRMPDGLRGIVDYVDDAGQIHVNWENGRTLPVIPEIDSFHRTGEYKKRGGPEPQR